MVSWGDSRTIVIVADLVSKTYRQTHLYPPSSTALMHVICVMILVVLLL